MKQLLVAVAAASLLCFAACKPSHEEMKKQFIKNCESGITGQPDQVSKEDMHAYCECSADNVFSRFSEEELIAFNNLSETEREEKLAPVVQPCLDELMQKSTPQPAAPVAVPDSMDNAADTVITPAATF